MKNHKPYEAADPELVYRFKKAYPEFAKQKHIQCNGTYKKFMWLCSVYSPYKRKSAREEIERYRCPSGVRFHL